MRIVRVGDAIYVFEGLNMMSEESPPTWLLAQLRANCAQIAVRNLKRQGFRTFLPMEDVTIRRSGKFVPTLRPMFPGYLFVAADPVTGQWRPINSTHGVSRLVSFGQEPATVPVSLVNQLMMRCDASGRLLPPVQFGPGDQVRVTSGPFAGFLTEVVSMEPDQRVLVLMQMMGGHTRVTLQAHHLRAV